MKYKKKLTILIGGLFMQSFLWFSQEIKTYNGKFTNGTATYEYYENADLERIYHGKFVNVLENNWTKVSGEYSHNKMHGKWTRVRTTRSEKSVFTVTYNEG